jgi:PAS domain S-box-containing protein
MSTPPPPQVPCVDGALSVLLLEDNAFDAELTIAALRCTPPCSVRLVRTRDEYIDALPLEHDIILSDFSLPGFSGTEALELALHSQPTVPFVFISGVLGEEHAVDMLKRGATDYVVKSRLSRLPLVVERAISESRERQKRQQAERALRESEDTFRRMIESLEDYAVILLGRDGRIRSGNRASAQIFGRSLDELAGEPGARLYASAADGGAGFEAELRVAASKGSCGQERWLQRGDGERFFANCVTTAFRDDDGELSGYSLIVRDITTARAAAEALQQAKLAAERASQAKDRFIAVLSHELRTPLVPILTGAELLQRQLATTLSPPLAKVVQMIRRNAALEARLIDDLLDVTSIERGKLTLDVKPLDLLQTLDAALATTREELERKQLRLTTRIDASSTRVSADEARLQQVFLNLLHNAIKFTPAGGAIEVKSRNPEPNVIAVEITDSGIGFDPATRARIFAPFEQADGARVAGYGGLGLGLAIANGLVARHGGELLAESEGAGRGSRFIVRLRTLAAEADMVDACPHAALPLPLRNGLSILLVEDNPDAEAILRHALEVSGHAVHTASTVAAARTAIEQRRFDIAISDIGLPDGSGLDVARAIDGRMPCIAVSGYGMEEDCRQSLLAGFAAHLIKPVDSDRLQRALAAAIRLRDERSIRAA